MGQRRFYGRVSAALELPNLLEGLSQSYGWFLEEGLDQLFAEISPIKGEGREELVLELGDPRLGKPHNSEQDCKDRNLTYSAPLRVKGVLKQHGKVLKEDDLYLVDLPLMTSRGTFIINGAEKVLVNYLHRSPGLYFYHEDARPQEFIAHVLPEYGAWLEMILDTKKGRVLVNLDRGVVPVTTLLRALGMEEEEIIERFSFTVNPLTKEKLASYRGYQLSEEIREDGQVLLERGEELTEEAMERILRAALRQIKLLNRYIQGSLAEDKTSSREEALLLIYRKLRSSERLSLSQAEEYLRKLYFDPERYNLTPVGRFMLNKKLGLEGVEETVLRPEEILLILERLLKLPDPSNPQRPADPQLVDDKDHLANKRVKAPGEMAWDALRSGLLRMARITQDRLSKFQPEEEPLRSLVSARVVQGALNNLFYTGRFCQFLEQINPLAELTHKRRLTALGNREGQGKRRAKIEVRDVHPSHYGRICPIETPEGQNIGLITSIATYARINEFGFLEVPYRKVEKGKVTNKIVYLMADEEERYNIAPATTPLDAKGHLQSEWVEVRTGREEIRRVPREEVHYIEISPVALVGVSASLIPFLEHDDSNRALMGTNMQRQAVPLLKPQAPYVGTGMEEAAARDSGMLVTAHDDGVVKYVDKEKIVIKHAKREETYHLLSFERSNQDTLIHQRPIVSKGEKVKKGQVIADGPASDHGELALGTNVLVGFLPFEGFNYEDAIVISERLVRDDVLDSIHIQEFELRAEETKLGSEEITADIPDIGKEDLRNLDEDGVVRLGTEVQTGDILVGKITPRGESEPTPEERIFRSIFGERAQNVKNTSLRLPPITEGGKVIRVKKFSRQQGDELEPGVNELVKVYIAQRKKISVGDKLAGRHGNKGVIAKVLPVEDMPFLPDGRPLDIVFNPLGVPSRMNLGQIFEAHLGWLAHLVGEKMVSPVFDGAREEEILFELHKVREEHGLAEGDGLENREGKPDGKVNLRDGRTGEPFEHPVTVGYLYIMKLEHIADEKLHARSTGPYSLITQQPLGGKAQFGGQRLGEMEVWALEAYGAANLLQEMLTIKSDDTRGRVQLYKAILKGEEFPRPGVPESFKVLVRELRSLCLSFKAFDKDGRELDLN
ncbi:MAG: DNA-directed RNA polymerase subunit beta [Candidatus Acetothermia bacterium]|jgi:DNA-directed RNA polymerase subunit beta|nr:DNA-directed RNA polymerase subunit beta [Candidatus Acetothermia bacterium]MDH7504889.1 DNA-directed RNA polymerase subunit beta [Candidatus Acetothermia bacterium]